MPLEIGGTPIPKTFEDVLVQIRDRIKELVKQYGSLSRWGRPYLYSLKEVALIYWLNTKLGISLDRLASFLGVDKTALYKLVKKIDKEGKVSYYDPETNSVKTEYVNPQDLINLIEEELQPKAKMKITDIRTELLTGPCTLDPYLSKARRVRSAAFIEIHTDVGVIGLGETYAGYFYPEIVPEIVEFFKPILLGQGVDNIPELWQLLPLLWPLSICQAYC